jgi:hypothetical protein
LGRTEDELVRDFRSTRRLAFRTKKAAEDLAALSSLTEEAAADAEYALALFLAERAPIVINGRRYESLADNDGLSRVRVTPIEAIQS